MATKTETPAADTAPAYVSRPITAIPKKVSAVKEFDPAAANALLALVFDNGAPKTDGENVLTASDGASYPDRSKARVAANKAKRLLAHIKSAFDGFNTVTRVYQPEGAETWEWALWMEAAPAKAASK